ncbi:replicative DNA helicase [Bartonella rochalimae]|uniref:Replicative DNA helicase n=1 Tax=Bartonella rochalimae ATCC BAA-1498 TaxID=685782 RepID=E6YL89_9HYPH|nr:replicative DNA helicase [Bartonella rochalimae]KEC54322.1 replicative DNA helicase [Bartonella rochalimae ATCC BAA-1498]CBI77627.1 Replicative DNA helicase [Bartonella rochalimae ATCC BAA-1498]
MEETGISNLIPQQKEESTFFRQMPHNIEAEQALLGAILINNDALDRVSDFLKSEHFFQQLHQQLFEVVSQIIKKGKLATPVTIKPFIPAEEKIGDITVFNYVIRLAKEAVTIINAEDYGRVIYDLFIRRSLINLGNEVVNTSFEAPLELTPIQQIEKIERDLFQLAEKGKYGGGFESFDEAIKKAIDMAGIAKKRSSRLSGIATHIKKLDEQMGGLQPSDLIIIAGRPGMGKTALATNIAFNIANTYNCDTKKESSPDNEGGIVGFFSLEMSSEQLATRIISEQIEVSSSNIRRGNISEEQFAKLLRIMNRLQKVPLYIDQTGGISITQLAARARRLKRQHGLDVLIIDYIQLMTSNSKRSSESRVQEITEITTGLKALAKELNVPIIALSQLSRQVENRTDKRPQLSDLRESGSIEQDADVVIFVYREEYYLKNEEPKIGGPEHLKWQASMDEVFGKADIIVAKQRHGPTGIVKLSFQADFTRFSDLADSNYLPEQYG